MPRRERRFSHHDHLGQGILSAVVVGIQRDIIVAGHLIDVDDDVARHVGSSVTATSTFAAGLRRVAAGRADAPLPTQGVVPAAIAAVPGPVAGRIAAVSARGAGGAAGLTSATLKKPRLGRRPPRPPSG